MSHHLRRLAFISTHTSPLARPGTSKAGGMNVYIAELTAQLGMGGCAVDIYTRADHPDLPETVELAPNVRVVHIEAGPLEVLSPIAVHAWTSIFTEKVAAFAAEQGCEYDLIHSHYWLSGLSGATLANRWRVPHVAMFHTLGEVKNRARRAEHEPALRIDGERDVVRQADRLICATPHERDFLVQLYGADWDCIDVVPPGVDLDLFSPGDQAAARASLGLGLEPIVLFVGRMEPLKGVDILIRAAGVVELDTTFTVLVAGGDPERDQSTTAQLEQLAVDLGIGEQVQFLGTLPREQLPSYYRAADVCVVPSYYESFGLVAVEALASGTPVIATRVGGLQYTVHDGQTGYLVSWRCPEPFAERMETLLENDELRGRFAAAAPESVRQFSWDQVADQIVEVYEDVLERHASGMAAGSTAG
jgi:D-inositol-3-phosphate glycosyltransferase